MPRRPTRAIWLISLLMVAFAGSATALGLAAYRPAHSDVWLAVLSFFTSALAVAISLTARAPVTGRALVAIPAQLPVRLEEFRGREFELEELTRGYHRRRRELRRSWRRPQPRTGPTILYVEGMPGVGKTALAQVLAHRIVDTGDVADGQLYANLGFAGGRRPPADVLHDFLSALGIPDDDIPPDTVERAKLFRSLTVNRRLLVLLDAARGNDQIRDLLPAGDRCVVIITRRSSIGPVHTAAVYRLKPLDTGTSLEILGAFSRSNAIEAAADAAQIVDYAGGLPLALRSAGEQVAGGHFTMRTLADELAKPANRLERFRYRARDIGARIESEYDKLMPDERRALQLLSIIESPTFGPWALAPLMDVGEIEAEKLVARLATYNLVEERSGRQNTGLTRYRLHPLVWLVARNALAAALPLEEQLEARQRLNRAYLGAASRVLDLPTPDESVELWARLEPRWLPQVRDKLDHWVRAEYCALLGVIRFAYRIEAWDLSWNIAARLGACVTTELPPDRSIEAFDDALLAADRARSQLGRIEVLLARGSFLIAVERFGEAFADLREALEATDAALGDLGPLESRRLWASAHRRKAEGWLQLGAYASANRELEVARAAVKGLDNTGATGAEVLRINLLVSANDTWRVPAKWLDQKAQVQAEAVHGSSPDDGIKFRSGLDLADQAQRMRNWARAVDFLRQAYFENYGDDRRIANVQYRTARLLLNQSGDRTHDDRAGLGRKAVGYASDAVRIHRKMGNRVGLIRAETLLASALRVAGYNAAAAELSGRLKSELEGFDRSDPARRALQARSQRLEGEILTDQGDHDRAGAILFAAASLFFDEGDWRSAAKAWLKAAAARRAAEQWDLAQQALDLALGACTEQCQDEALKQEVERERRTTRLMYFPVQPGFPG